MKRKLVEAEKAAPEITREEVERVRAISYTLGQRQELSVFCANGAVSIDNNASERKMKRVVLNRKNILFVGKPRGGRTAAILSSLTSSCHRHGVDQQPYFTQPLINLPTLPTSQLPQWLPGQWKIRQNVLNQSLQKPNTESA